MKTLKTALSCLKMYNIYDRIFNELGKLGHSLAFEQTFTAAANVYTFGKVSQICINYVIKIISKGNIMFFTFSIN